MPYLVYKNNENNKNKRIENTKYQQLKLNKLRYKD